MAAVGCGGSGDQALAETALLAKASLGAGHAATIVWMIVVVAEQVEQAMKREHAQLGAIPVTDITSLTPGDAGGNDDIA